MKTTLIKIRNLLGIKEMQLNGASVEITGTNGAGKSSVIEAIRYALTNTSERDIIVRKGETEAEILLETNTGLHIERKKRESSSDYKKIAENGRAVQNPESFLREIFTPLQLDPVKFTQMTKDEQNRIILDLIQFDWDLAWINQQFGEIPPKVNYEQNILQVLAQISAENGHYFQQRQDINRDIRTKRGVAETIAKDMPPEYNAAKWETYDTGETYRKLNEAQTHNSKVQRAKQFRESYQNKLRGLEATRDIALTNARNESQGEREGLQKTIERLKAEIKAAQDKLLTLDDKLTDKTSVIIANHTAAVEKLKADTDVADEWADKPVIPAEQLQAEIETAEAMKLHLNEYKRMKSTLEEIDDLTTKSDALTAKIELARKLPADILKTAIIPVAGLTVENGVPLINGLPVSNLSEGEQLDLCVDITISKPGTLQIILIDGAEKLSDTNRARLYAKCKAKGLQFIATRTTNDDEMVVTEL